ncbi:hypothetical protein fHeYen901_93 [Yersinia phage fHe-Yen9-01]|uniref:Uncharacterized protein n=1 Tax=Yersinia phage fHe-Yen9-01 TaxID=1965363 RepID=A0A1V0DXI9_9CAUD|nr:hypothetical protein KNT60_gp092 [Yersinia phage fHe-Yen9-01]ARB05866.1 hypothetical protein fHeYen901_93 [Yersinia phage fHe-Yen9-01]
MSIKLKLEALKRYETNLQMARKSFEIDMAYSLRYPVFSNNLESDIVCKTVGLIAMDRRQIAAVNVFKNLKATALQVYKTDLKDLEPKRKPSVYFT